MQDKYKTLEEMWARQRINHSDVNYDIWYNQRSLLTGMSELSGSCIFTVDVYKQRYAFVSKNFTNLLGYERTKLETIERQGDYFESRFHPDDYDHLLDLQIKLGNFIYELPSDERNDYRNIFQYRVLGAAGKYVNVVSRQQVLLRDNNDKAWIVMGIMEISPDQSPLEYVKCSVANLKTGRLFTPSALPGSCIHLTKREIQILLLIKEGALSKEIADRLGISLYTVSNHRKNILNKLNADNSVEAINNAKRYNIVAW